MKKSSKKIGIVGLGRFGTLTASVLAKHAEVLIYHHSNTPEIKARAKKTGGKLTSFHGLSQCDYILITVPISKTESIIKKLAPIVKPGALVMDACSVKIYPCRWLKDDLPKDIQIMGTHPMFGPVTSKFDLQKQTWKINDKQIVLCPLRIREEELIKIKNFLKKLGLEIIITTPENHDRQNANTLALVHYLGRALVETGVKEQKIYTPGYVDLLKIIPHTASDNWQLFFDMNNFNPYAKTIRKKFIKACDKLDNKIIKSESKNNFDYNRRLIDKIDQQLFKLLEERYACVNTIGRIKKKKGLPIVDKKREQAMIDSRSRRTKLNKKFVEAIYKVILNESYRREA